MATRFFPIMFVLLWATGFIGAGLSMPYAEPFSFMAVRFSIAAVIMILWALASRSVWPRGKILMHAAIAGCLIHGIYLSALFWAVHHGLPAGMSGLVAGLQPMLTTLIAALLLGERASGRQWLGLLVGFLGVAMVVWPKFSAGNGVDPQSLCAAFVAVLAISTGTVWQKRFGTAGDLKAGTAVQYIAAATLTAIGAFAFETRVMVWSPELIFAMVWLTLAISIGAILALLVMIREGAMSKVASLFYLVPGTAAIMAYLIFGETLGPIQIAGMVVTTLGVALTTLRK
ncbi:DMT family transporter [Brucella pituitosa]|uniref:DMT family transporter n=1 Tax=Brucella pituitosa TaxID=571256 RepID=UPI000C27709D|nr:DMT family transporter [Brucella pituitosa]MCK4205742.1 DMT family transporter [Brucella pituitosa]PJO46079.1 EamA family transporter [Brucella pituitosa]PRA88573.1 EamA family transporter [Ochrobactrum sp. MYb29]